MMRNNELISNNMPLSYPVHLLQTSESTAANATTGVDISSQPYIITRIFDTGGSNNIVDNTNIYRNDNTKNMVNMPDNSVNNTSNNDSRISTNINNMHTNVINKGNASEINNNNSSTTNYINFPENCSVSNSESSNSSYLINLPNSGLVLVPSLNVQPITSTTKPSAGEAATMAENVAKRASRRERNVMLTPEQRQYNLLIQQRNVYLSGFPPDFRPTMFRRLCEVYGRIDSSKLAMTSDNPSLCRGYGFVLFTSADSAKKCIDALNGFILNGHPLQARRADLSAGPLSVYAQSITLHSHKHVPSTTPLYSSLLQNTLLPNAHGRLGHGSGINQTSVNVPLSAEQNSANISAYTMAHILQQQQQQQQQQLQLQLQLQQRYMEQQQQQDSVIQRIETAEEQLQQIPISTTMPAPLTLSSLPKLSESSVSLMPLILNTENCNPSMLSSLSSYVVNSEGNKGVSNAINNAHWSLLSFPSAATSTANMQLFEVDTHNLPNAPTNENTARLTSASSQLPQLVNVNFITGQRANVHSVPPSANCETNHAIDSTVLQSVVQPGSTSESCGYISASSNPPLTNTMAINPISRSYHAVADTGIGTGTSQHTKTTVQPQPLYVLYSPESNLSAKSYMTFNLNAANIGALSTDASQNTLTQNVFVKTQNQQTHSPEQQPTLHEEHYQLVKTPESSEQQSKASCTW